MKIKINRLVPVSFVIATMLLASCGTAASKSTTTAATSSTNPTGTILTVTNGNNSKTYTMHDIQALAGIKNYGGTKNKSGVLSQWYLYDAIPLTIFVSEVEDGGIKPGQSVKVTGSDGYSVTYTYDQLTNGNFTIYDITGVIAAPTPSPATVPTVAIAYWQNGNILDSSTGPLELCIIYGEHLFTDGALWVKMVNKIEVISGS